jgi:hypothetical protein
MPFLVTTALLVVPTAELALLSLIDVHLAQRVRD